MNSNTDAVITHAVLGEAIIDLIVGEDGLYRPHLGGSPYNVAIGLARQGIGTSYLSPVSGDRMGEKILQSLRAHDVHLPDREPSLLPTSLALITIDDEGVPAYRLYREGVADKDWHVDHLIAALPADLRVFHTGSLAITPSQLTRIHALLAHLRERNVLISIDLNIRIGASQDTSAYLTGVRSLLALCDLVKASDEDVGALDTDRQATDAARHLHQAMDGGVFVMTRGAHGALVLTGQELIDVAGATVEKLIDTVGAGDTFQAAFLAALQRAGVSKATFKTTSREVFGQAARYACMAAAINVARAGCQPPTHAEVEHHLTSA